MKNKKGVMSSTMIGWIIAIVVLAIVMLFAVLLKDQLAGMAGYIKNLFR